MRKRIAIVIASLLVLVAVSVTGFSSASSTKSSQGLQLDGTWMVTVTRINPPPGLAPTFKSLMSYARGGVMIETATGSIPSTRRGPALGQWERIGNRRFATSMWFFRFDPVTGISVGSQRVDRTMQLSRNRESFTAVGLVQQFDVDGNPVGPPLRATEVGQRLAIHRIP